MNYPVWNVPYLGSGLVIAIIAIIHVLISHFAIGGGFFLYLTERKALKEGRKDWLERLPKYSKFFLVLTGVVGAMTGVGIWFSIGLANPAGTSALIHNFVFGWATEWVIFLVELSLAAAYYYTWGRLPHQVHLRIGLLYAIFSFLTLVIINGILTFKLTPSSEWLKAAGTGNEAQYIFEAFFNPTYWPSLALRTLVCISMGGIMALVFFSRLNSDTEGKVKKGLIRWASLWLLPAFVLMPICFIWYLAMVPESQRELLSLGISTIGSGAFTQVTRLTLISILTTATIVGVVYFLAYLYPKDFEFGHALAILFLALLATTATEGAREMLRKPYIILGYMYSNGTLKSYVAAYNQNGYMSTSPWQNSFYPASLEIAPDLFLGKRMFDGQCLSCHTVDGYRSIRELLKGRDEGAIGNILEMMRKTEDSPYAKYMPPLVGTNDEVVALRKYLYSLVNQKQEQSGKTAKAVLPKDSLN